MKPAFLHRFAPSSTLLCFLRAQSELLSSPCTTRTLRHPRNLRHAFIGCENRQYQSRGFCLSPRRSVAHIHQHVALPLSNLARPGCLTTTKFPSTSLHSRRPFTASSKKDFLNFWRSWLSKKQECAAYAKPQPLPTFLDENDALRRRLRATNEMRLRCTELDENGKPIVVNEEFKKTELIQRYGLLPRDLRKIDSSILPHILVRPTAILLNLLHLRVLIKHDRVLVFDAYGTTDSYNQSSFMYDIDQKLRQKESASNGVLAYEFRALEAVLLSVTNSLESEFEGVSEPVVSVLRELEEDIDRDSLRYLLIYSKKLGTFEQKARLVRDALTELLEADDDLSSMYLTEKAAGKARGEDEHTEVEMLLESYHKVADEIVQAAENLVSNIRNTEEIVKAILDANRNSLMLLDLKFTIFTVGIGAGTFVAALYGMNLKNFIEESDLGFFGISTWCTVFGIFVCVYGLHKLRSVQRVSMWGERGRRLAISQQEMGARRDMERKSLTSAAKRWRFWEKEKKRVSQVMSREKPQRNPTAARPGEKEAKGGEPSNGSGMNEPF